MPVPTLQDMRRIGAVKKKGTRNVAAENYNPYLHSLINQATSLLARAPNVPYNAQNSNVIENSLA